VTDDQTILEYFKKSYFSVDGLWFVKLEEEFGFEKALEIDRRVWEILPKVQARHLRRIMGIEGDGIEPFFQAIKVKLEGEGYTFTMDPDAGEIRFKGCPWHEIMIKAGREHLSARVGEVICATELGVWAREFGLKGKMEEHYCNGAGECVLKMEQEGSPSGD
jgi:hypothetical protein